MFLMFFYKSEKHVFYVFYLQINVFNIYAVVRITDAIVALRSHGTRTAYRPTDNNFRQDIEFSP